ncbi:MAG TPA: hypothetical protein VGU43_04580 [Thermoplasmata archaeon]|nr:hypothetical protein [Thermoplasmata archaeon]
MNRFDLQFWEGARESALAIYDFVKGRPDVPLEVREFVLRVLVSAGEKKNRDFRESIGAEVSAAREKAWSAVTPAVRR